MSKVFGSSGKTSNPLGTLGVLTGVIGAAFSILLWFHYYQPETEILGSYSTQIHAGVLGDQMQTLATAFGLMAVIAGIGGGLGGRGNASTVASLLLGVVALSYPVLIALDVVERFVPNPVG